MNLSTEVIKSVIRRIGNTSNLEKKPRPIVNRLWNTVVGHETKYVPIRPQAVQKTLRIAVSGCSSYFRVAENVGSAPPCTPSHIDYF
jgi:hypothetical protein